MPLDWLEQEPAIRIVWSRSPIEKWDVLGVLEWNDLRISIEHILTQLNHKNHPQQEWKYPVDNYSPKRYIDSPKTALDVLEELLNQNPDVFDKRNPDTLKKIITNLYVLLSEYYGNQEKYNINASEWEHSDVNEVYRARQRLTDSFHFITWNIINNRFEVSEQLWEITPEHMIPSSIVMWKIETLVDFPNIKKLLSILWESIKKAA